MNEHTCCQPTKARKTLRDDEAKTKLINRLARIEGQIRGIRKMIEENAYCTDVLTQSAAVSAALGSFNREVLDAHLHGCVAKDLRAGEDSSLEELLPILQKLIK